MVELHDESALELWTALQRGETTPTQLVEHTIDRVERLGPRYGAFATVTADAARERARLVAESVPRTAPLWGIPLADKDLVNRAGVPTGFGSRVFAGQVAAASDELVDVLDAAGSVSLGKTATPEFGLAGYTEPVATGPVRNPWDPTRGAGGSSGGAAAAVAARLLPFAPGSDGGGSIRIPAAACGLVGLKPSRGLVPAASGISSLAGLAVGGSIARTVTDAAFLLDAMIGRRNGRIDHHYTLRAPDDNDGDLLGAAVRGEGRFQIGILENTPWDDDVEITVAPEAAQTVLETARLLTSRGHGIETFRLDHDGSYPGHFRGVWYASAAGLPVDGDALDLLEPLTRALLERGRAMPSRELIEHLMALTAFERSVIAQFSRFDAVMTPTLALTPRPLGWFDAEDADRNFAQQCAYEPYTSFVNVAGLPAITLPVLQTAEGLPMGVQLIGRPGGEATLLSLGRQLERSVRWELRRPPGID
ncbi:amidase [Paramicrobacterium humi]|uniref:Amidase n=1 Tax=Paramicrobacterium humi TaxID=640635 RepID=A0A1H4P7V5_9MICO|nr:amidase [Microbacterium humi]SEC03530.1 amidase [Microbacterium humi]